MCVWARPYAGVTTAAERVILYTHGHTPAGPVHLCYACYSFWSEQQSRTRTVCALLNACVHTRPRLRRWGAARRGSRPNGLIAHCSSLLCGDRGPSHGLWPRHSARDWLHAHRIRDRGNQRGYTCQIDESIEPSQGDSVKLSIASACVRGTLHRYYVCYTCVMTK